jgi:hypothetical protein
MMMVIMLGGDDYDDDAAPKPGRVQLYGTASLSTFHFPSRSALLFHSFSFPFPPFPQLLSRQNPVRTACGVMEWMNGPKLQQP